MDSNKYEAVKEDAMAEIRRRRNLFNREAHKEIIKIVEPTRIAIRNRMNNEVRNSRAARERYYV